MQYVLECLDKTAGAAESVVMNEYHNTLVADEKKEDDKTKEDDDTVAQQGNDPNMGQQNEALMAPPANELKNNLNKEKGAVAA